MDGMGKDEKMDPFKYGIGWQFFVHSGSMT